MKKSLLQTACEDEATKREFHRRAATVAVPAKESWIDRKIREAQGRLEGLRKLAQLNEEIRSVQGQLARRRMDSGAGELNTIIEMVAAKYEVTAVEIVGDRRPEFIARPRQIVCWLARKLTDLPLARIGDTLGGRDHGTVLHGERRIQDLMDTNPAFRAEVLALKDEVSRVLTSAATTERKAA